MKRKLLNFLWVLVLFAVQAQAQTRTITGVVTGKDDGLPLPGVTVKSSSSQVGTVTGSDGKYSIKVSDNSSITFSFIGYATVTVPVAGKTVINAVLTSALSNLDEVVVTGVGVATKKSLVAIDVASVGSKDFAKSANINATQALVGQIPGVQIVQRSSQPGSAPLILLRSNTTLGGTQPLILVDGVQVSSDILTSIDPNIIDHVEVVKGSAGGMLYGAQGAQGVIQVFTKRGAKNGKLSINVASQYSNDRIIELNDIVAKNNHWVLDANGNILTSSGAIVSQNADGIWTDPAALPFGTSPKLIQNNQPYTIPTYDHVKQANRVANTFTNSVNIRGGSEKTDYAFGMSNVNQQDVFSSSYNRTNLNLNLGFNIVGGLTFRTNTQLFYTWQNLQAGSRFNMIMTPRFIDLRFIDPNTGRYVVKPSSTADGNNPLAEHDVHSNYTKTPRLLQNFNLNYKFKKFVEIDAKYSIDQRTADQYDLYVNQTGLPQTVFFGGSINGAITDQNTTNRTEYGNGGVYFRTDFKNDFHSNLPIRTTTQVNYDFTKTYSHFYSASGTGLQTFSPYTISGSTTKTASENFGASLLFGYLVNQTVDWGELFGISGGFRSDYASTFGAGSKPFTFPRGTIYFNPSELFKGHDLVYNWKLRAAYGEAGIQPGSFDRQITLNTNTIGATNGLTSLTVPATLSNPDLHVQTTKELELGTDITVTPLKNSNWMSSATFSGTYWHRSSNDAIQTALLAPSSGATGIVDNLVSLTGHGIDLSLDINAYKSKDLDWFLGARFAIAHTYVTKISNGLPINASVFTISQGQELGQLYAQTPLHSVDQLKPDGTRYIATSDVGNYVLVNGDVVNKNTYAVQLTASNDLSYSGNVYPNFTSSLINRFNIYKKLNVSFQFDWNHGQKIYNSTRQYLARDQLSSDFDKNVTIDGNTGSYVAYWNSFYNALNPLSSFIEDGSFIRLRDVSVSYDLSSLVKAKWLKSLIVTASARNIATWTKYSGLDPEVNSAQSVSTGGGLGSIGAQQGVDYYGQPNLKSYQFSVNIGF